MSENVRVAVRVRPFNEREKRMESTSIIRMDGSTTSIKNPENGEEKKFTFDFSYWSHDDSQSFATQDTVFNDLGLDVLRNAFKGFNVSLFAYGQTGSGKSYSMVGYGADKGIVPRVCDELFRQINENKDENITYAVETSMMEIYNEKVRDLLNPAEKQLKVREHPKTGPYVESLSVNSVHSYDEISKLMEEGSKVRTVASTNMNATSSRAHTMFVIVFTQTKKDLALGKATDTVSKINLVDLAGSERLDSTGASGETLKQGCYINKSLTCLGNCISALAANASGGKQTHVPYRDSVLTWLLKESLGGNAKTIMIAALSPASVNYDETLSTLRYADRAKQIKNKAIVNEDPNQKLIRELRQQIEELKRMGGGGGGGVLPEEVIRMREELAESQRLIAELSKTREEKEAESAARKSQREHQMESMGINVTVDKDKPHLVNLNEDPLMTESLVYYLKEGETQLGSDPECDIKLSGLGMESRHAVITRDADDNLRVIPGAGRIFINGQQVTEPTDIHQGYRVIVGMNHVFRVNHPAEAAKMRQERGEQATAGQTMDWEAALKELAETQGQALLSAKAKEKAELEERLAKMEEEKRKATAALEEQMRVLQEQSAQKSAQEREEMERRNKELLAKLEEQREILQQTTAIKREEELDQQEMDRKLINVLPMVNQANLICEEMQKQMNFEIVLSTRVAAANMNLPEELRYRKKVDVVIQVNDTYNNLSYSWSYDKFVERLMQMRDVYQNWKFYGEPEPENDEENPFIDEPEQQSIGISMIYLSFLGSLVDLDTWTPIINFQGENKGQLHVELIPIVKDDEFYDSVEELVGKKLEFDLKIDAARGLPRELSQAVVCRYRFFGDTEDFKTQPTTGASTAPTIGYERHFEIDPVTPEVVKYIKTDALAIEVVGQLRTDDAVGKSPLIKDLPQGQLDSPAATKPDTSRKLQRPRTPTTGLGRISPLPDEPLAIVPKASNVDGAEVLTLDGDDYVDDPSLDDAYTSTPARNTGAVTAVHEQRPSGAQSAEASRLAQEREELARKLAERERELEQLRISKEQESTPQKQPSQEPAVLSPADEELRRKLAEQEAELQRLREQARGENKRSKSCVLL